MKTPVILFSPLLLTVILNLASSPLTTTGVKVSLTTVSFTSDKLKINTF
jgi:hypothetical protein